MVVGIGAEQQKPVVVWQQIEHLQIARDFVDRVRTPRDADGDYDYESLYALDLEQFNADLNAILAGKEVELVQGFGDVDNVGGATPFNLLVELPHVMHADDAAEVEVGRGAKGISANSTARATKPTLWR